MTQNSSSNLTPSLAKWLLRPLAGSVFVLASMAGNGQLFAANLIANPGFENSPPSVMGNNIGHAVAPWIVGSGSSPNVVKVDGPGGYDYYANGPESDGTAPGAGKAQHYLDIANGSNVLYQSFEAPACKGAPAGSVATVSFSGKFSTRANTSGDAKIEIHDGTGPGGALIASQSGNLPAGNSKTDPWKTISGTASVTRGSSFTYVVRMDNNMNFDDAVVEIKADPCDPDHHGDADDPDKPHASQCLRMEPKVSCENGQVLVTLTASAPAGFTGSEMELSCLTPGVTVSPDYVSPVTGNETYVLSGASPGQTVTLMSTAVDAGAGSRPGLDQCCTGVTEITIPDDEACKPKKPEINIVKACEPLVETAKGYQSHCTITVTGSGLEAGDPVVVEENLSGNGTITAFGPANPADGWTCDPVSSGNPLGCSIDGADLMAAGGTSVIDVTVTFPDEGAAKEAENCASALVDAAGHESPGKEGEEAKSCTHFTVDKPQKPELKVEKACGPARPGHPPHRFVADCTITVTGTNLAPGSTVTTGDLLNGNGTITAIQPANPSDPWTCDPVSGPPPLDCRISGADLTTLGGTSVINVTVGFPDRGSALEAQNCAFAEAAVPGASKTEARQSCTGFTVDDKEDPVATHDVAIAKRYSTDGIDLGLPTPGFEITVNDVAGTLQPGDTIVVDDVIPAGMSAQLPSGSGWTCGTATNGYQCSYVIPSDGTITPLVLMATGEDGLENCAEVTAYQGSTSNPHAETVTNNNKACASISGKGDDVHEDTKSKRNLTMEKKQIEGSCTNDGLCQFALTVTNTGDTAVNLPQVTDTVSPATGVQLVSASAGWSCMQGSGGQIVCTPQPAVTLQPGQQVTVVVTVRIAPSATGRYSNCAVLQWIGIAIPDIRSLQQALAEQGFDPGLVDGAMGGKTREAIAQAQRAHGLPVTGKADARLFGILTGHQVPLNFGDDDASDDKACVPVNRQRPITDIDKPVIVVTPPTRLACDPQSAVQRGKSCACRFGGAVKVSPTACACPRGSEFDARRGRCMAIDTGLACDPKSAVKRGQACACRFGGAVKVSPTACACPRGTEFDARRGRCGPVIELPRCVPPARPVKGSPGCACPRGFEINTPFSCTRIRKTDRPDKGHGNPVKGRGEPGRQEGTGIPILPKIPGVR